MPGGCEWTWPRSWPSSGSRCSTPTAAPPRRWRRMKLTLLNWRRWKRPRRSGRRGATMLDGWKFKPLGELVRIASGQVDPKDAEIARNLSIGPDNLRSGGGLEKTGLKTAGELEQ